jgi:LysM repeat protein
LTNNQYKKSSPNHYAFFGIILSVEKTVRHNKISSRFDMVVVLPLLLWLAAGLSFFTAFSAAEAAPRAQIPIYTPTPQPDGRIIYIVQANDTLLGISLLTGVPLDQLRGLNNLTSDTIYEGQQLLLGLGGPAEITPTAGPTSTPTPILPTPSPKPGQGTLCILLFNDLNGDSIRQANEDSIPDGAISFGNSTGSVSESVKTVIGTDPQCFENLPEGIYTISVAAPEGYNPTTTNTYELSLAAGDITYVNFGAQANSQMEAEAPAIPAREGGRSPLLGIIGGVLLLGGIIVAIVAARSLRNH